MENYFFVRLTFSDVGVQSGGYIYAFFISPRRVPPYGMWNVRMGFEMRMIPVRDQIRIDETDYHGG